MFTENLFHMWALFESVLPPQNVLQPTYVWMWISGTCVYALTSYFELLRSFYALAVIQGCLWPWAEWKQEVVEAAHYNVKSSCQLNKTSFVHCGSQNLPVWPLTMQQPFPNLVKNQNYGICLKLINFGLARVKRWKVRQLIKAMLIGLNVKLYYRHRNLCYMKWKPYSPIHWARRCRGRQGPCGSWRQRWSGSRERNPEDRLQCEKWHKVNNQL